jgi:hypothetical protein
MLGHLPVPPQPHFPTGLAPAIGYLATREPQPLEERTSQEPEWWELDDEDAEDWGPRHPTVIKITAIVVSVSLVVAGLGTVFELLLSSR